MHIYKNLFLICKIHATHITGHMTPLISLFYVGLPLVPFSSSWNKWYSRFWPPANMPLPHSYNNSKTLCKIQFKLYLSIKNAPLRENSVGLDDSD